MTKEIKLTRGKVAIVDDRDYEWANQFKWQANFIGNSWYAVRTVGEHRESRLLHRQIIDAPHGAHVDHINRNGLDCRRSNLRLCTHAENIRNSRVRTDNSSGYKGVNLDKRYGKWQAYINKNGKRTSLGMFFTAKEAAIAYDDAARELHGEFARLNFEVGK